VVSSFPLGEIIQSKEATGRIAKWSVELMSETLTYVPHKAIKSQARVDFVAEWTDSQLPPTQVQSELWTMYFDGSLMKTGAGAGLLFISPLGVHMRYVIRIHFAASNNVAEYEALVNVDSRTNSMASSSSTSPDATTRQLTNSPRSRRPEAWYHLTRSQEIFTSHPSMPLLPSKPTPSMHY